MKKINFLLYFFFTVSYSYSQGFHATYGRSGSEIGTCIQPTADGNYIINSFTTILGTGYEDAYLLKVNSDGALLWSAMYGGSLSDKTYYVATCSDGGYILTGATKSFGSGNYDLYLLRTDSEGNHLWSKAIGGTGDDQGWNVLQANDGGFLASGFSKGFGNGSWDGYLVKTDSDGSLLWTKVFGGSNTDAFYGLTATKDGGYALTGLSATHSAGSSDIWLLKLDSNADTVWTKLYGKATEDAGNFIVQTKDGGYAVAGDVHITPNNGAHHAALLKTDSQGILQWINVYGGNPGTEIAYVMRQLPDDEYLLLGNTSSYGLGSQDIFLLKAGASGNLLWTRTYGGSFIDDAWYLQGAADNGNMIVAGTQFTSAGQHDIYLINTDSDGNSACRQTSPLLGTDTPTITVSYGTTISSGGVEVTCASITTIPVTSSVDPCALTAVQENELLTFQVNVYPNPFVETTLLQVHSLESVVGSTEFKMYDILGNEVRKLLILDSEVRINRENLPSGIYFYQIISSEKIVATGKIMVE